MRRRTLTLVLACGLLLWSQSAANADEPPREARANIPSFALPALTGDRFQLDDTRGSVVVISFWATWCVPCLHELPHLDDLFREHEDRGLRVVAISTDGAETVSEVRALVAERGWSFTVLLDAAGEATSLLNPRGTNPFTLVLDRQGRVAWSHEGYAPGDEIALAALVERLLDEDDPVDVSTPVLGSLSVTNTAITELHRDNGNGDLEDDNYALVVNRLNASASHDTISASIRVDGAYVYDPPTDAFEDDLRPERVTARWARIGDLVTLTGGDFYRQLGRGIALSLRKIDEAALDVSLQGGQIEVTTTDHHAAIFGGRTNVANLDDVSRRFVPDRDDIVVGALWEGQLLASLGLGAHAVYLTPEDKLLDTRRHTWTGGLSVQLSELGPVSVYLEGDIQNRTILEQNELGYAAYLSADLVLSGLKLLTEGLYLDAFEMNGSQNAATGAPLRYNQPPTLERIDQEVFDQRDVVGGRLLAEYAFDAVSLQINGAFRRTGPDGSHPVDAMHGYGGVEWTFDGSNSRLGVSGGYRREESDGEFLKDMIHGELDLLIHLVSRLSLHAQILHESRKLETRAYERGTALLGLDWAGVGSLTGEFGYDTLDPTSREVFGAVVAGWQAQSWFDLQVTAGTRRGGLRCVNGVCRNYPSLAGFQARVVSRW